MLGGALIKLVGFPLEAVWHGPAHVGRPYRLRECKGLMQTNGEGPKWFWRTRGWAAEGLAFPIFFCTPRRLPIH